MTDQTQTTQDAQPQFTEGEAPPSLSVGDLVVLYNLAQAATARGAIRAEELTIVGTDLKALSMATAVNEKAIKENKEEKHGLLLFSLNKLAEEKFSEYMKQNDQLFQKIKKTYGQKILDKMINDQKIDFMQVMQNEYLERRRKVTTHTAFINTCNEKIESNQKTIEYNLSKEVEKENMALDVIEITAKETGTFNAETEEQIRQIKSKIEKAEIESDVDKLNKDQDKKQEDQNEADKQ